MERKTILIKGAILAICLLWRPSFGQNIDQLIRSEISSMNKIWGYPIEVDITENGKIESQPNNSIKIGRQELNRICETEDEKIRNYLIRFVLAHEFAHQIQYYIYRNNDKIMNNDLVSKTLLETQADLMAGQIFFFQDPILLDKINDDPKFLDEVFLEIFRVGFSLGSKEVVQSSHPSKHDRILAIRTGLMMGLSFQLDQMVKANPNAMQLIGMTPAKYKTIMDEQFNMLDYRQNEQFHDWAYRQAQKIVNYDRKILSNLVLITPENDRHHFDTNEYEPYVYYDLTYKNTGQKALSVNMEAYVTLIQRDNPDSGDYARKLNTNNHKFIIAPGATHRVKGKINWLKNEVDFLTQYAIGSNEMPRIVYPDVRSEDALISCSYLTDYSNSVYQEDVKYLNFNGSSEDIDFQIFYNSLMNTLMLDEKDLIQGIGELDTRNNNHIVYLCSKQFKDDTKTTVITENLNEVKRVELEFPNMYPNKSIPSEEYAQIKDYLDGKIGNSLINEGSEPSGSRWAAYNIGTYSVYIRVIFSEKYKISTFYFSVERN